MRIVNAKRVADYADIIRYRPIFAVQMLVFQLWLYSILFSDIFASFFSSFPTLSQAAAGMILGLAVSIVIYAVLLELVSLLVTRSSFRISWKTRCRVAFLGNSGGVRCSQDATPDGSGSRTESRFLLVRLEGKEFPNEDESDVPIGEEQVFRESVAERLQFLAMLFILFAMGRLLARLFEADGWFFVAFIAPAIALVLSHLAGVVLDLIRYNSVTFTPERIAVHRFGREHCFVPGVDTLVIARPRRMWMKPLHVGLIDAESGRLILLCLSHQDSADLARRWVRAGGQAGSGSLGSRTPASSTGPVLA